MRHEGYAAYNTEQGTRIRFRFVADAGGGSNPGDYHQLRRRTIGSKRSEASEAAPAVCSCYTLVRHLPPLSNNRPNGVLNIDYA